MSYVSLEPDVVCLDDLKALALAARVVERRTVHLPALGIAFASEIAMPGDADYPAGDPPAGEKLVMKCEASPHGLITETAALPAAFVFVGDAAALEEPQRPGDEPPVEVEVRLAFKFRDPAGNDEARQRRRSLVRDFVRRLRNERAGALARGGALSFGAVSETAGADATDASRGYLFFDCALILTTPGTAPPATID